MQDILILILIPLIFTSMLVIAYALYVTSLKKRIIHRENTTTIDGQRERLESQVYEVNKLMLSDPYRFFDNNRLLLETSNKNIVVKNNKTPNYSFFYNLGIDIQNISVINKRILCIMPFHRNFNKLYDVINKTCCNAGYECLRSDDEYTPGNVLQQIIKLMLSSELIVAILDGKNPNVYYEIGIAHSIGKPVILIAHLRNMEIIENISFDLKVERLLLYSNYKELTERLLKTLEKINYA